MVKAELAQLEASFRLREQYGNSSLPLHVLPQLSGQSLPPFVNDMMGGNSMTVQAPLRSPFYQGSQVPGAATGAGGQHLQANAMTPFLQNYVAALQSAAVSVGAPTPAAPCVLPSLSQQQEQRAPATFGPNPLLQAIPSPMPPSPSPSPINNPWVNQRPTPLFSTLPVLPTGNMNTVQSNPDVASVAYG